MSDGWWIAIQVGFEFVKSAGRLSGLLRHAIAVVADRHCWWVFTVGLVACGTRSAGGAAVATLVNGPGAVGMVFANPARIPAGFALHLFQYRVYREARAVCDSGPAASVLYLNCPVALTGRTHVALPSRCDS